MTLSRKSEPSIQTVINEGVCPSFRGRKKSNVYEVLHEALGVRGKLPGKYVIDVFVDVGELG